MSMTQWTMRYCAVCSLAVVGLLLGASDTGRAQDHPPEAQRLRRGKEHRRMLADNSGVFLGKYEGTLYCLRHDFSGSEADKALCRKEGRHVHVLVMKRGYVHPLYGVNEQIHTQIHAEALHGKSVKIKGKFYPTSNAILVSKVTFE